MKEKECELHFGDSTAHETAKWFLDQLRSYDDINDFPEDFDKLCKDLNAVRFVDCLRKQVDEDEEHFKCIENIATKLLEEKPDKGTKEFKDYPNLSVLLLSIAQSSLLTHDSVKNTKLYEIGNNLYETFKNNSDLAHIDLALKAGFQLSKFQDDSNWKFQFSEFKNNHYERLTIIRRQYFSTDNPSTFSLQVVKRYKLKIDNHSESEDDNRFKRAYLNEFKILNPEEDFLRPLYLQLPILARSTEAMRLADRFAQNTQGSKLDIEFSTSLAKKLRILQWNILGRNLVEEDRKGTLSFHRIKRKVEIHGVPEKDEIDEIPGVPDKDFLIDTLKETRFVECLFSPEEGEIPMQQRAKVSPKELSPLINPESVKEVVEECYDSSRDVLLSKVLDFHPRAYEDLVRSFAEIRDKSKTSNAGPIENGEPSEDGEPSFLNAMLIEDGELSFFSILWLLRYAAGKGEAPENWEEYPGEELSVRFRPSKDKSRDNWWSRYDLYKFAEECGLIICLPNTEKCILTQRWRSLITWLGRINKLIELTGKDEDQIQALEEKVVKKLADDEGKSFVEEDLRFFFALEDLKELLGKLRVFSSLPMQRKDFAKEQFGPLVKLLGPLLEAKSTGFGLDDTVLLRRCRASFIPLEHLFRAYWPCELHLLIQALNWEKSSVKDASMADVDMAPISLGFATIAGRVETDWNLKNDSEISPEPTAEFAHWLVPYRTLFSTLSNNLTLVDVKDSSKEIGKQIGESEGKKRQRDLFAHQTAGLLSTIWRDKKRDDLDFQSIFSLWLAMIQTREIWGGVPIDPRKSIRDHFPAWECNEEDILKKRLVPLGLWGGIMRATKPRKNGGISPYDYLLGTYAVELESRGPDDAIDQVRKDTQLKFSKNPKLPQWIKTEAFAICFYHGLRQAAYHALETFVLIDEKEKKEPCLSIEWDEQSVSISNRGEVKEENRQSDFETDDSEFFDRVEDKISNFCDQNGIGEKFKIEGPKPSESDNIWQWVIRKVK